MKIQNIINLYAYRSRMCSLEKFCGDVNSRDLLHNLNIPSYTLLLRMSDNLGTTFLVMGISVKLLINFQFSTSATSTVIGLNSKIHPKSWKKQNRDQMQKNPSPRARNPQSRPITTQTNLTDYLLKSSESYFITYKTEN